MKAVEQKSQFSNFLVNGKKLEVQSRFFKNPNFPSLEFMNWEKLGSIHSLIPTFQNPNFESKIELGKFMS